MPAHPLQLTEGSYPFHENLPHARLAEFQALDVLEKSLPNFGFRESVTAAGAGHLSASVPICTVMQRNRPDNRIMTNLELFIELAELERAVASINAEISDLEMEILRHDQTAA